jgi:hypothetical protein
MARLLAAAILICASVLGFAPGAGAGWYGAPRGRSHHYRGRGRGHHYRHHYNNPVPGILGGILGGWLSQQLKPEPPRYEGEEDESPRDRR